MYEISPLGAMGRGALAGAVGSFVQNQFFKVFKQPKEAPRRPFVPPEKKQANETSLQTIARRYVEHLMQRGPLTDVQKTRLASAIHYGFGADWGAFYGACRETFPAMGTPLGVVGFGLAVWGVSDNLVLPGFRLANWPQDYGVKTHAYAAAAHVVYGAALALAYEATRHWPAEYIGAALVAVGLRRRARRFRVEALRPVARKIIDEVSVIAAKPIRRVAAMASA